MQPFKTGLEAHQWVTDFSLGPENLSQFTPFNHLNRIMLKKKLRALKFCHHRKNGPSVKADE